ncbi:hypothetical protein X737_39590 [Mesorhizobium sp. L48C026A00]|nr:hypothetical protein X737_39590 [Mesorhizobium sp. L48C026A00]
MDLGMGKSKALRAYQRRTKAADALIASSYSSTCAHGADIARRARRQRAFRPA